MRRWSLTLGKVAGISIMMHWTFLILLAFVIFSGVSKGDSLMAILVTIGYVLAIFSCVLLHELGHSLTAKRYGIGTRQIMLLPIGGVASLERIPDDPKQELFIAVAGPAVNVAIAAVLYVIVGGMDGIMESAPVAQALNPGNFLISLFFINLILVLFNAIPAFPMDGGRVLRALLAMHFSRSRATLVAARLGQIVAVGFAILGLLYNPFLLFIGIFVFLGAYYENAIVQRMEMLKDHKVSEAMMTNFSKLSPEETVANVTEKMRAGHETYFAVVENDELKGTVSKDMLLRALDRGQAEHAVSEFMNTTFEPVSPDQKLTEAFMKFHQNNQSIFPVLANGRRIIGMLTGESINDFILVKMAIGGKLSG